jgi:hypothetical protein
VDDVIQETPVHGMSRTVGFVQAELIPNRSYAAFDVVFGGTSWSQTVGVRPNVFLYTFTTTPLTVRHRVVMDGSGIRTYAIPGFAESTTQLVGIESRTIPADLTVKIAQRGYCRSQAAAEAESAAKTASRVSARVNDELTPSLANASQSISRELKALKDAGLTVQSLAFHTSPAGLHGRIRIATPGQRQPGSAPPAPADADLSVRVHEALAAALAQAELGGRSFFLDETSKIYDEVTRGILADARPAKAKTVDLKTLEKNLAKLAGKPVIITFARKDPLTSKFASQEIAVEIRIASIRQENTVYVGERLRVVYRIENTEKGAVAIRKGPVQVLPDAPSKADKTEALSVQFKVLQEVLFAEVFKERLALNAPALPAPLAGLGAEAPRVFTADGWATIAWKLRAATPSPAPSSAPR